jgi:hypothetical protein
VIAINPQTVNGKFNFDYRNSINTFNRSSFFLQNQHSSSSNSDKVLKEGTSVEFIIQNQPDQLIEQIKYCFSLRNDGTTPINVYSNPVAFIELVTIFANNKEIQKLDTFALNLINLLTIRETAVSLKKENLGYNNATLAAAAE